MMRTYAQYNSCVYMNPAHWIFSTLSSSTNICCSPLCSPDGMEEAVTHGYMLAHNPSHIHCMDCYHTLVGLKRNIPLRCSCQLRTYFPGGHTSDED